MLELRDLSFAYPAGRPLIEGLSFTFRSGGICAVLGPNGTGKTTLLKLLLGILKPSSGEMLLSGMPIGRMTAQRRARKLAYIPQDVSLRFPLSVFEFVLLGRKPWFVWGPSPSDVALTGTVLSRLDLDALAERPLANLSGGQRQKVALARALVQETDWLLLDEPTNHLDMETASWLEGYLRQYPGAVVMVSHDRFFMDRTADIVYELEQGKLTRYPGNYTNYREQKRKNYEIQMKSYLRQQEEIERQEELIKRFKNKPSKAAFARSRKKILERMLPVEKPREDMAHIFTGTITPLIPGSKWVFEAEHLKIGYDKHSLLELSLRIRKGQKIGILGVNGSGKTTFLKTVAGFLPAVAGECALGNNITIGYFDQYSAAIQSEKTVVEHFSDLFPSLTDKEVRTILGAYLFKGKDGAKRVDDLSGGEKARLVLAELLQSRPNFLILDEPTNHMDIQAKETLESAFQAYEGTILFVSHDRYFIRQVAESLLIFDDQSVFYYPFGYEHYLAHRNQGSGEELAASLRAEEQALLSGLQSVPMPERHRLREYSTEQSYEDWQLRLMTEPMEQTRMDLEQFWNARDEIQEWTDPAYAEECLAQETILTDAYTKCCLAWYGKWAEFHPEPDKETGLLPS